MALITQLRRALYSPLGRRLAQRSRRVVKPLLVVIGMRRHAGRQPLNPSRPTLVVVSHEASATGAPILALNLCQELSQDANIVVLLLRGGLGAVHWEEEVRHLPGIRCNRWGPAAADAASTAQPLSRQRPLLGEWGS